MRHLLFVFLCAALPAAAAELHPIVEVETGYLMGAAGEKGWIPADKAGGAAKAGTQYQLYSLTGREGEVTGGKAASAGAPCDETLVVPLKSKPKGAAVALAGPWNAQPRLPKVGDNTQEVYVTAVREFLVANGLRAPQVKITQILRIDLEGDGEDEVLISGSRHTGATSAAIGSGDYSFVLLRRVVKGNVQTQMLSGEFYPKPAEFAAPNTYKVAAILDLNGDGRLEVVVHSAYYEGAAIGVFVCTEKEAKEVIGVGCGA